MRIKRFTVAMLFAVCAISALAQSEPMSLSGFSAPAMSWRPIPLWFWNNTEVKEDAIKTQLDNMITKDKYGGCALLPFGQAFRPEYLSDEYFRLYGKAIETAKAHGAKMSLYDEYGFPSGSMGAINGSGVTTFKNNHPGMTIRRLDKSEYVTTPGQSLRRRINASGTLMAVVAMETNTKEIISLRDHVEGNILTWDVPEDGTWKIMSFVCVEDGDPNVNYLSPEAVSLFVQDTHEAYYKQFPEAFGTTITTTFFDEPTMYRANGRMWTDDFNEKFTERFGFSPETIYPALWYDIGPKTAAARNCLFGMRAALYAEGFMKTISEWAEAHGILSTGHQDQEEVVNPVSVSGDLMLDGKYMGMPGIDKIGGNRPAENFYKVVSSSANNWDKTYVMSETYGDMGNISMETMYRIATEQYTKGINQLIPHAVWYDNSNVTFLPELSYRNPLYNYGLADFNTFLSRLNYMLARPGRHVADVAVVYPITTMQAGHYLDGPKGYYQGGVDIPGIDYNVVSAILTDQLGVDFTYVHPEVIDDRCDVTGGRFVMSNKTNSESFSVIIVPGCKVMTLSNMKKIEKAWENGVKIIFTTQLPQQTADMSGEDDDIASIVNRMLVTEKDKGNAVFVENPTAETLRGALADTELDVRFSNTQQPFNYIHKVISGGNVYYFGNIDGATAENTITLKGKLSACTLLDPRTGKSEPAEISYEDGNTVLTLKLAPEQSAFLVENKIFDTTEAPAVEDNSYTVEMKVKIDQLSAGICFAGRNTSNYYMWQVNLENPSEPKLRPHRWFDGRVELLDEVSLKDKVNINTTDAFNLKIAVENGVVARTYINGVLVDERYGQFAYGLIGFRETHSDAAGCEENARFDDIRVSSSAGETLFAEDFSGDNTFSEGSVEDGWLCVTGAMTRDVYAWPLGFRKLWYTVEADLTLLRDDACLVFSSIDDNNYYMWAVNIFDGNLPRIRRHVYNGGNLTWSDTEFDSFSKSDIEGKEHHVKIEVKGSLIKTYIDGVLVDTFMDFSDKLVLGDVGFRIDASGPQKDEAYFDNIVMTSYAEDGTPEVVLEDDFEPGGPTWFSKGDIVDVEGNHKLWMHSNGLYKLMQDDSPTTSIAGPVADIRTDDDSVYTLGGVRVDKNNLASGIYISNGRKIVVK